MVWYSHLFQNFPQFIVIHTVKGFDIVHKAEIDVFLELSCFFDDPAEVGNSFTVELDLDDKVLGLKPELDALDKTLMGLEREEWTLYEG